MDDKARATYLVLHQNVQLTHLSKVDTTNYLILLCSAMTRLPGGERESSLHTKFDQEIEKLGNYIPGSNKSL